MIKLSKYRAKTLKKDCPHSTRCIGLVTVWMHGKIQERYITILTIYGDESIRCRGKYSDDKDGICKAQYELDDFADNHDCKYAGTNEEIPEYDYYKFSGGYIRKYA